MIMMQRAINPMKARTPCSRPSVRRGGFTLIELLVVILIILLISAVALPTVVPAISHRQVSEAGRILQGSLVGARDAAIHNNGPSGIRLLPDPVFPIQYTKINNVIQIDPTVPLAYNRIIPIEPAPQYSEGKVNVVVPFTLVDNTTSNPAQVHYFNSTGGLVYPLPPGNSTLFYPYSSSANGVGTTVGNVLMVEESVIDPTSGLPNSPTSWFWNIRVGDKIQINNAGVWYTVVGPMAVTPFNGGNTEMFVNVGPPGTPSPLQVGPFTPLSLQVGPFSAEFLFLVNGQDDNGNGWVDEGWDGANNNGNTDANGNPLIDELLEWEGETWQGAIANHGIVNSVYSIQRRPAPTTNAREISLPTNVVIDATTWGTSQERSRLPINQFTGYVDILVYPSGTIVPTTIYSSPASLTMSGTFLHFWLAERSDVAAPTSNTLNANAAPFLPLPKGLLPTLFSSGAELKGEYRLITLNARTGQLSTDQDMGFDPNLSTDINAGTYNANYPFLETQQGVKGGP
jgi:prepilin-type N-terminal cleavage/methylation domain-containing protein